MLKHKCTGGVVCLVFLCVNELFISGVFIDIIDTARDKDLLNPIIGGNNAKGRARERDGGIRK